jgi:chromosome segregation ATPase
MSKVGNTSTKAEIMSAYEELLEQIKAERKESTALRQELDKKQALLEKASNAAQGGAVLTLQQIRKNLNAQLDQVESNLTEEQQKYETIKQGVAALQQELNALHQIKAEAESLEALVMTNRQAKDKLEKDMEARRLALETDIKEAQVKGAREQEAYEYDLKLKRRNEQDAYNEKKAKMDKDLSEKKAEFDKSIADREQAVAAQELELKRLQKESDTFERRLAEAVREAEKSVTERLTREFEYQQKLQVKDLEAELRLREQMIQTLETKVKDLQDTLSSMSARTDLAGQQVKDIALKAIEKSGVVGVPMERRSERNEKE